MTTYRITVELDNVAEGDVTDMAQWIWDENALSFDAPLGEFRVHIAKVDGSFATDVDWQPND